MGDLLAADTYSSMDVREAAAEVRRLVGPALTAYLADLGSVAELDRRLASDGEEIHPRLRLVLSLAEQFRGYNAITRFRAWLREFDAESGGKTCPAEMIRDTADPTVSKILHEAAGQYLRAL